MASIPSISLFIQSNKKHLRFFLYFIIFFIAGQALNFLLFPITDSVQFKLLNAKVASNIINTVSPSENSVVEDRVIRSGRHAVEVGWGCEATDGMITLGAGVLALQIPFLGKLIGLLLGSFVIYIANLCRIVSLYFILKYGPQFFDFFHIYVGQVFLIIIAISFFILWAKRFHGISREPVTQAQN